MDHDSTLGVLVRFLFGLAGLGAGLFAASLGLVTDGRLVDPTPLLPGWRWLLVLGGAAFAFASILWAFTPRRDVDA